MEWRTQRNKMWEDNATQQNSYVLYMLYSYETFCLVLVTHVEDTKFNSKAGFDGNPISPIGHGNLQDLFSIAIHILFSTLAFTRCLLCWEVRSVLVIYLHGLRVLGNGDVCGRVFDGYRNCYPSKCSRVITDGRLKNRPFEIWDKLFLARSSSLCTLVSFRRCTEAAELITLSIQLLDVTVDKMSSSVFSFTAGIVFLFYVHTCSLMWALSPKFHNETWMWQNCSTLSNNV